MQASMGLDTVEFMLWPEQEFGIEIPNREAENILTVGQFSTYVHQQLLDMHVSKATSEAAIFKCIQEFLVCEFKIAPANISHDSNFVTDLRLDR